MAGSNTFGGTTKLEGEKAYREAVKQINSNLRVLASEMGKVTAEFTKNDNSTTALTSRNKILNEQIEKQKEKISVLKNALAQSSEKVLESFTFEMVGSEISLRALNFSAAGFAS